jgi:hypothetical protein
MRMRMKMKMRRRMGKNKSRNRLNQKSTSGQSTYPSRPSRDDDHNVEA